MQRYDKAKVNSRKCLVYLHRLERNRWYRLSIYLTAAGIGLFFFWPLLYPLNAQGLIDTDRFLAWQLVMNDALRQGELLHWMPYVCGGVPALSNPEYGPLSPLNFLGLLLNPLMQFKLEIVIHLLIMPGGFWLIARSLKLPFWTILFGVAIWGGNGFLAFRLLHGQTTFFPLMLSPLLVGFLLCQIFQSSADSPPKHRLLPGAIVGGVLTTSFMILQDGLLVLFYTFLILVVLAGLHAIRRRDLRPLAMLGCWIIGACLLCAARIVPMVDLLLTNPRIVNDQDFLTPTMAFDALFAVDQLNLYLTFPRIPPHNIWAAYGAFIGFLPVLLAAYSALRRPRSALYYFLPVLLIGLVFMFGNFADYAPWSVLRQVPPLTMVRAPHRFVLLVLLSITILSMPGAYMLSLDLGRRIRRPLIGVLVAVCLLVGIVAQLSLALNPLLQFGTSVHAHVPERIDYSLPLTRMPFEFDQSYRQIALNQAVDRCREPMPYKDRTHPNRPFSHTIDGSAQSTLAFLPNELRLTVAADTPAIIAINHNHHPNWASLTPKAELTRSPDGTMLIKVPKGRQTVVLRYEPQEFRLGLIGTSLFISFLLILLLVRRKNKDIHLLNHK